VTPDKSVELSQEFAAAPKVTAARTVGLRSASSRLICPPKAMAAEFGKLSKPYDLKVYPPVGRSGSDGHNFEYYTDVALWEHDVFKFLDRYVKH
jgi:hypothetical protein